MTPEAKVKKKAVQVLKELSAYYFYPVTGGYGRSGVPDIVVCYKGLFIGIECKAGKNKPTPLQEKNLDEIRACLLYTSPSPRDRQKSRMPSSA